VKLLLLSIEFPPGPGGLGALAYQAALNLTRLGWQVCVATPQTHASQEEIEAFNQNQPFEILRFEYQGSFLLEAASRFAATSRRIARMRPDLLLSIGGQPTWLGAILSITQRLPLAAVGVGSEFLFAGAARQLTRLGFSRASQILFISNYTRQLALAAGIRAPVNSVIPLGADQAVFQPDLPTAHLRNALGLADARLLLTVGRVCERKAQDVVIRALPLVLEQQPDVRYVIVGLPVDQQKLEDLSRQVGVFDQVVFAGKVSQQELPEFYNLSDLFVLVSRRTNQGDVEGFGIAVLEAALCGKPAIVSRHSGLEETIINGETGLLVPPEDPQATAQAILKLLGDDDLRRRMGQAAMHNAQKFATWEKRISEYDRILKSLIRSNKPA
jgi:phosphatidylinositol alpha-1,6-mannosyltransferase